MLTGSTSTEQQNIALRRLEQGGGSDGREIRVSIIAIEPVVPDNIAVLCNCKLPGTTLSLIPDDM
jgi:hypothetical protein